MPHRNDKTYFGPGIEQQSGAEPSSHDKKDFNNGNRFISLKKRMEQAFWNY